MCEAVNSPEKRRFRRHCQIAAGLGLVFYVICSQASLHVQNPAGSLALSGVAGASLFAELVSVGILITGLRDEFQRALLTRSFIWGTLVTMALSTIWGFIELHAGSTVPHLDIIWLPMILIGITAGAKLLIFRQYRPESD